MSDRHRQDEHAQLEHARTVAHECAAVASQLAEFADQLSAVVTPSDMVEFDTLVAREATALSRRVEAFGRLGLGVGSLEATGSAE